jgi:hypothetical protein
MGEHKPTIDVSIERDRERLLIKYSHKAAFFFVVSKIFLLSRSSLLFSAHQTLSSSIYLPRAFETTLQKAPFYKKKDGAEFVLRELDVHEDIRADTPQRSRYVRM